MTTTNHGGGTHPATAVPVGTARLDDGTERPTAGARPKSRRKPYNRDAGYVCSKRTPFGHAVVYDRERGGDWIDGTTRWVVATFDARQRKIGLLDCTSERSARTVMKDAADGDCDWCDWLAHVDTSPVPEETEHRYWTRTPDGYTIVYERTPADGSVPEPTRWLIRTIGNNFRTTRPDRNFENLNDALAILAAAERGDDRPQ